MRKLLEVLHRLTDLGNTVIIIEHNLDIVRNADYVLDMGPEGGERGGRIVAHGTPEQIATVAGSYTGNFLARHYGANRAGSNWANRISSNGGGGASHAGPQPLDIAAVPDRVKTARANFIARRRRPAYRWRERTDGEEGWLRNQFCRRARLRGLRRRTRT